MVAICELLAENSSASGSSGLGQLQALASAIQSNLDQLLASKDAEALSIAEEILSKCDQEVISQGDGAKYLQGALQHGKLVNPAWLEPRACCMLPLACALLFHISPLYKLDP